MADRRASEHRHRQPAENLVVELWLRCAAASAYGAGYRRLGNVGQGTVPLLVFDAWEHAYYMQYRNVRPDYVSKLWGLVNWSDVSARFASTRAGRPVLPAS